jgi:hypothetical protein
MESTELLARPWWVNLALLVPLGSFIAWRRNGLRLTLRQLAYVAVFAIAFGIDEAVVVVYLRGATGLLSDTAPPAQVLALLPESFLRSEVSREAATIVMLLAVSLLAARRVRERWALFLWTFAFWDISYYIGLWLLIGWPPSLFTQDVLFLIPNPWVAQVWFPILVSLLAIGAVLQGSKDNLLRERAGAAP